jgi:hypothetical protein
LADWRLSLYGICFGCSTLPAYAFAYFLPVILAGGGYSTELSLILSAPPYIFAGFYVFGSAFLADKYKMRSLFIVVNSLFCTTGLLILGKSALFFHSISSFYELRINMINMIYSCGRR